MKVHSHPYHILFLACWMSGSCQPQEAQAVNTADETHRASELSSAAPPSAPASQESRDGETAGAATCETPPRGMVCIPGGKALIGSDAHTSESPQHSVYVETFYMDRHEVTNGQYRACETAGICPKRPARLPAAYHEFLHDELPAIPMTWKMAQQYCVYAGKRLPTEAEWEKAARGSNGAVYPWGNEPPSCDRAHFKGCPPGRTLPAGSLPEAAYGLFDMAGNGFEWVKDWASPCYDGCPRACGADCLRDNPQGPCGGAPSCKGRNARVLKGGSWYWPADQLRGSFRRAQKPNSGLHRLSFRCAASSPTLTQAPAKVLHEPWPELGVPQAPSAAQLEQFAGVRHDTDIMEIEECQRVGKATHDCRDPMTYIKTNERAQPLWVPYIQNIGGGYVGLGADQNYNFIAKAKSRWAWLFDYDPTVVRLHHMIRAVVLESANPNAFVAAFSPAQTKATKSLIRASLASNPAEVDATLKAFDLIRPELFEHYRASLNKRPRYPDFGWLAIGQDYQYIRTMMQQGRIQVIKGNMLTNVALPSIAKSAKALGVPIRVYYSSNADSQWRLTEQYRQNIIKFPFDGRTVVLRTVLGKYWNPSEGPQSDWHYVVHHGQHMQDSLRLKGYDRISAFMEERLPTHMPYFSTIRLPGLMGNSAAARLP